MINLAKARQLRALIEEAAAALSDEQALSGIELFPVWKPRKEYETGERVSYLNKLYKVIQSHASQADWTPDIATSLYIEVALPGVIPVWKQPAGAHDAYQTGDKVYYPDKEGHIYVSIMDNNIWAPDVYGWNMEV